ncbi:late control protein [Rhodococcus sp. SRB_17]|uniref:phage late control D family protein n=1 Tax=Acidovorax sp. SRB_24 TaxID=1962700 RepID=UPI00145EAB04|nr:phage late control D family protein [Acidovorax sp. SRB_24]NMM75547.1 late control protein [Acidovorax sp. SRB_24]NMM85067.1 late control protein [Rhodococcus sp. SRB_17]
MSSHRHPAPDYRLVVNGQDITAKVNPRLIGLTLSEGREGAADTLELTLADHDGQLALPRKGATIELQLGWRGQPLVDKGSFEVDEVEHSGAPDQISIKARSADLKRKLRQRTEKSWHDTTVGAIVQEIAARHGLASRVGGTLASTKVEHIDQTNESDLHFLSRLAKQHDAVATVKKGHLLFLPINGTKTSSGAALGRMHITRADGDQHRYHSAERGAYSGVRAYWSDPNQAEKRSVLVGTEEDEKRLKDTHGSEQDALAAARAERQRVERGKATLSLTLAVGHPALMPQSPVTVAGFKPEIDGTSWLVKTVKHQMGDAGFITNLEMERSAGGDAPTAAQPDND